MSSDKLKAVKLKHKEEMDALKSKLSVVSSEKLVLLEKLEGMKVTLQTQKDSAQLVKDAAINKLVATHAIEMKATFKEGADFCQGLMQK